MAQNIIKGIVYIEMNEDLGPNPVAWLPSKFNQMDLVHISIKTLTVLSGEKGLIPESLVILPFTSMNLKGLIKYIKWDDKERRGGIGQSALILLFQENDDVIFLHCLPSFHDLNTSMSQDIYRKWGFREMEVTDEVFRSKYSVVFDEAENRMHSIKAIMVATIGNQ